MTDKNSPASLPGEDAIPIKRVSKSTEATPSLVSLTDKSLEELVAESKIRLMKLQGNLEKPGDTDSPAPTAGNLFVATVLGPEVTVERIREALWREFGDKQVHINVGSFGPGVERTEHKATDSSLYKPSGFARNLQTGKERP